MNTFNFTTNNIMSTLKKPLKGIAVPSTRYNRSRNIVTIIDSNDKMSRVICTSTNSAIKYMRQYAR